MRNLNLLLIFTITFLFTSFLAAQQCGSVVDQTIVDHYLSKADEIKKANLSSASRNYHFIPLKVHIIRDGNGDGGVDLDDVQANIDHANEVYEPNNMLFYQCGEINFIDDQFLFDYPFDYTGMSGSQVEVEMAGDNNIENVINVYFVNNSPGGSWAYFPIWENDWIIMNPGHTEDIKVFAHEIGHYFSLFHTFENYSGVEKVTRDPNNTCYNCLTTGDQLCDTNADPGILCQNVTSCVLNVQASDNCGGNYNPDVENVMSYSCIECLDSLSQGQFDRVLWSYLNERDLNATNCENDGECCLPISSNSVEFNCMDDGLEICLPEYDCQISVQLVPLSSGLDYVYATPDPCIYLTTADGWDPFGAYEIRIWSYGNCEEEPGMATRIDEGNLIYNGECLPTCCQTIPSIDVNCVQDGLEICLPDSDCQLSIQLVPVSTNGVYGQGSVYGSPTPCVTLTEDDGWDPEAIYEIRIYSYDCYEEATAVRVDGGDLVYVSDCDPIACCDTIPPNRIYLNIDEEAGTGIVCFPPVDCDANPYTSIRLTQENGTISQFGNSTGDCVEFTFDPCVSYDLSIGYSFDCDGSGLVDQDEQFYKNIKIFIDGDCERECCEDGFIDITPICEDKVKVCLSGAEECDLPTIGVYNLTNPWDPQSVSLIATVGNCQVYHLRCSQTYKFGYYNYEMDCEIEQTINFSCGPACMSDDGSSYSLYNLNPAENKPIAVRPNPFKDKFQVQLTTEQPEAYQISIFDTQGKLIAHIGGQLIEGNNSIIINHMVDAPAGLYFYKLITPTNNFSGKLIKN